METQKEIQTEIRTQTVKAKKTVLLLVVLLAAALSSALLFWICYQYDNKYTADGPQPENGVLLLAEETLAEFPVLYLIRDWEIYRGQLLQPGDFAGGMPPFPDELVFIGQYGGFEGAADSGSRNPHGSVTYRLVLSLPSQTQSYTLEVPEIFSAYKLYINGVLMAGMGDPDPQSYRAETGNRAVTVQAAGRLEILVAVSDFSHFYSGMMYPPAFGDPDAVAKVLNTRFGLRAAACAIALCFGFLYILIGVLHAGKPQPGAKRKLPYLYGALCICFVLATCYPVIKTLFPGGPIFYAVENSAYCAMLLLAMLIQAHIAGIEGRWTGAFAAIGIFVCGWALLMPLFVGDRLSLMMVYSGIFNAYVWICAASLTFAAAYGVYKNAVYSKIILIGMVIFSTALIMERLLPTYEPILSGWFVEIASGALVLCTEIALAMEIAAQYKLRQAMESRVESVSRMLEVQRAYYPALLKKEEEAKSARHDLRHHLAVIGILAESGDLAKLKQYLNEYDDRQSPPVHASYCHHYVTDMLLRMFDGLAARQQTLFYAAADLPEVLPVGDIDLCVLLSNLLENAMEATAQIPEEQRYISVRLDGKKQYLNIFVENQFEGNPLKKNGKFLSTKRPGRNGIGLASVLAVARQYDGSADFYVEGSRFFSEISIPFREKSG